MTGTLAGAIVMRTIAGALLRSGSVLMMGAVAFAVWASCGAMAAVFPAFASISRTVFVVTSVRVGPCVSVVSRAPHAQRAMAHSSWAAEAVFMVSVSATESAMGIRA